MKKIINKPDDVVVEMLKGLALSRPDSIGLIPEKRVVYRKDPYLNKVAIISGSGSGHEPDQAFYVGKGMLDAACAGPVFAAPTLDAIVDAAKLVDRGRGVLFLVKNYTGDRANFEMASEMLEFEGGPAVDTAIINDDVAVKDSTFTAGRRGVAGAIFVYKIIGAKSEEEGVNLPQLKKFAMEVNDNIRTMGFALKSCTTPAKGSTTFDLGEDEIELGVGLHGEPGRERTKYKPANEVIKIITDSVIEDLPFICGDEVALLINGLGGTPIGELYIAAGIVHEILRNRKLKVFRTYVNNFCTSLDMEGCSVSLLRLNEEFKRLLLAPADIPIKYF
ncbi:MAG: dihydroxyacetone kinase subunit DhaK [Actinobacteria bacterium]|nr:dihydroxyacetone kinase subunit DhaK [Actinomycetota bacterium]MBU4450885.1 dihydroxyacetone kinase subunit DhaK [Actinomycetota bacterium]MCG2789894.1 dihydroxyacetone kinase subunit DhaK [Actinomycetes bacterium]